MEGNQWLMILLATFICIGTYWIIKLFKKRVQIQRHVLQKKVKLRTSEISLQKEELQKQSEKLQKAYEEIKTKNMAIEDAFEHLTNSFAKLSDLNREKDGMMNIVVHDLRTPLNNIQGLVQLIGLSGDLNEEQKNYISKISSVVKGGNEMIRDLLDISQAKNYKPQLKITEFSMADFIKNWKANFEKSLLTKEQQLKITGNYEALMLKTDSGLLSRIMDNVMSNALKFSEKGKNVYLDVNPIKDQAKIIIRDEGPGISESDQLKMFKPFTRLTARPTNGEHSNGLGLSIIKSLSKQLGGEITVSSTLGEGTSFEITIPIQAENNFN